MRTTLSGCLSIRRGRITRLLVALAAASAAGGAAADASAAQPPHEGSAASFVRHVSWSPSSPARDVEVLSATFTDPSVEPQWTVTVEAPTVSPFDGSPEFAEAGSAAWAEQTVARLTSDGFTARSDTVFWPVTATIRAACSASASASGNSRPRRRLRRKPPS